MLTVIETLGKRKVDGKDVTFPRLKILTGKNAAGTNLLGDGDRVIQGAKPNEKGELIDAGYPTFAELSAYYKGAVEYQKTNAGILDDSIECLVKAAVAGWNQTESNAAFGRSPAQAEAQFDSAFEKMAKAGGWDATKKAEMHKRIYG